MISPKEFAEKEMKRMEEIFSDLSIASSDEKAKEFYNFAKNYFEDGKYFFEKGDYLRAFEAFVISWAYLDAGLKLGFFETKKKEYFTVEK